MSNLKEKIFLRDIKKVHNIATSVKQQKDVQSWLQVTS